MKAGRVLIGEGLNGCGKTTTTQALCEVMKRAGHRVRLFRDPGATVAGNAIRNIVKDPDVAMEPMTQMLLYTAARSQLAHEIAPFIEEGGHVIIDRWWPSTYVYQGFVGGINTDLIMHLVDVTTPAVCRTTPALTFFLDPGVMTCVQRSGALEAGRGIENGGDRFEKQGIEFQQKLHDGYMRLVHLGHMRHARTSPLNPSEMADFMYTYYIHEEIGDA